MELPELLERCRGNDPLAWEALVRRYQGRIYGLGLFYLGDPEEARDLAQEVFVRVYRRLDQCTVDETFVPWLFQIARNAAIDRLRRIKARPRATDAPPQAMLDLPDPGPDPEDQRQARRRRAIVHRALEKLSQLNREIILLKEIQGLSLESIASICQAPLGTIKSRSSRARLELARVLADLMEEESEPGRGSRR